MHGFATAVPSDKPKPADLKTHIGAAREDESSGLRDIIGTSKRMGFDV